ncbi:hypothetical protein [Dokdonella sp.]|uniref:hypothetical protein n=1 Tax=Dokdonella sp. TaxID=2291710 RepID=UPI0035292704
MRTVPPFLAACLLLNLAPPGVQARTTPFELEPVLGATAFVQPALMSGPGYTLDPHVEIRGYMAQFTLDTPQGPVRAESVEILADRVAEMPALETLDAMTHSQAFIDAASDSVTRTGAGIGQVLMHPIKTLAGIPRGVARYFGKRFDKLGRQAQSLSDHAAKELGNAGDPYPRADGPMTETRDIDRAEAATQLADTDYGWVGDAGSEIARELKRQIKYSQVRRELAERLGIDPYTSNPYLRERLDQLAWAGSGGRYAAGAALASVGGVGAVVLDKGSQLNELVWKLDGPQLREFNAERLERYCRDNLLMRQFLRRGTFTPTLQTALVDQLAALQPANGCDAMLELGMTAQSELEARYLVNSLQLVSARLGRRAHGGSLLVVGAGLAYDTEDGERVLPLPVDYLAWTSEVEAFIDRPEFRHREKTILISGQSTMRSQRELTSRGWNLVIEEGRSAPYPDRLAKAD